MGYSELKLNKRFSLFSALLLTVLFITGVGCNAGTSGGTPSGSNDTLACLGDQDCPPDCTCALSGPSGTCNNGRNGTLCGGDCTQETTCDPGTQCLPNGSVTVDGSAGPVVTVLYSCVATACEGITIGDRTGGAACKSNGDCNSGDCNLESCQCHGDGNTITSCLQYYTENPDGVAPNDVAFCFQNVTNHSDNNCCVRDDQCASGHCCPWGKTCGPQLECECTSSAPNP